MSARARLNRFVHRFPILRMHTRKKQLTGKRFDRGQSRKCRGPYRSSTIPVRTKSIVQNARLADSAASLIRSSRSRNVSSALSRSSMMAGKKQQRHRHDDQKHLNGKSIFLSGLLSKMAHTRVRHPRSQETSKRRWPPLPRVSRNGPPPISRMATANKAAQNLHRPQFIENEAVNRKQTQQKKDGFEKSRATNLVRSQAIPSAPRSR